MKSVKELTDLQMKVAKDMRDLHDKAEQEDRGFTAEDQQKWDNMVEEYDSLESRINAARKMETMRSEPSDPGVPLPNLDDDDKEERTINHAHEGRALGEYNDAFESFLRHGSVTKEERALLNKYGADFDKEFRAQAVGTDAAGGFTVPEGFAGFITETMQDFSGLLNAATPGGGNGNPTLLRTASGNTIPFPTNDDTANAGAILAENTQVSEQDLVFGSRSLTSYMYTSNLVRVSLQLLQDEAVNLQRYLGNILGKRIGRAVSPHFAVGSGTAQPTGLATAATDGAVDISAAAGVTFADLLDLEHALDPAYRRRGAKWVFNDTTLRALKGLLDSQNRPLWLPQSLGSIADNAASPTLMGYPYIVDQGMQDVGVGNRPIAFGDLSEFYIREVLGINLFRFNERYMDFLQIGWMAYARYDSNLIDTSAVVTDIVVA